jgi:glycosyltransferase involved in cell wall biosynthesis
LRTASLLEYLAQRYVLDVIVFREPGASDPAEAFPRGLARAVHVLDLSLHRRNMPAKVARNLWRLVRGAPPLNDRFAGFSRAITNWLDGRRYKLAVIEHFWCAPYQEQLAQHSDCVALDLHNIESIFWERCATFETWPLSMALRRFSRACRRLERRWLPRFDMLLVASESDAHEAFTLAPSPAVCVYPNTLPAQTAPQCESEPVVVFSGNLEFRPNVAAVYYFRNEIWPLLRERWPDLRWRLVGKNPAGIAHLVRGDSRIEVTGPVADAVAELAKAQVAVVPVLAGSGTRVKILEAWAAAVPVVSTSIGAEGLPAKDGEHLLIAENPLAFADAVNELLASRKLRRRIGGAGRALYEREFTWEAAWRKLESFQI